MRVLLMRMVSNSLGKRFYSSNKYKPVTHCIFDMDGLLLNTEIIYTKMMGMICNKYGEEYSKDLIVKIMGGTEQRASEIVCNELKLPITPVQFRDQLLELGDTMLQGAPLMDGAERLINHLHKNKVPIALATSSSDRSVKTKIARYRTLFSYFNHQVMGSTDPEVKRGKPAPDIFLVAAERFPDKPKPEKCLVFEDSPHGVTAGNSAGMQTVMVPEPQLHQKFTEHATIVLPSLAKFQPELFGLPAFSDSQCK